MSGRRHQQRRGRGREDCDHGGAGLAGSAVGLRRMSRTINLMKDLEELGQPVHSPRTVMTYQVTRRHNAWHDTMTNRYAGNWSLHPSLFSADEAIGGLRVGGSYFECYERPGIEVTCGDISIVVTHINADRPFSRWQPPAHWPERGLTGLHFYEGFWPRGGVGHGWPRSGQVPDVVGGWESRLFGHSLFSGLDPDTTTLRIYSSRGTRKGRPAGRYRDNVVRDRTQECDPSRLFNVVQMLRHLTEGSAVRTAQP